MKVTNITQPLTLLPNSITVGEWHRDSNEYPPPTAVVVVDSPYMLLII